jgi:hypothetical protein
MPNSPEWPLPLKCSNQNFIRIYFSPNAYEYKINVRVHTADVTNKYVQIYDPYIT